MKPLAELTAAILVTSDRASRGEYPDLTGPALEELLRHRGWRVVEIRVVPDEREAISRALRSWCDAGAASLLLTAGGTGLGPRDVTPESTRDVIERDLPGIPEVMRARGSAKSPHAALSRAIAGSRGKCLIVNLPGSPRGAVESLECVLDLIPHALEMLGGGGHEKEHKPENSRHRGTGDTEKA